MTEEAKKETTAKPEPKTGLKLVPCAITGKEFPEDRMFELSNDDTGEKKYVQQDMIVSLGTHPSIYPRIAQEREKQIAMQQGIQQGIAQGRNQGAQLAMNEMIKLASELGEGATFADVQKAFLDKLNGKKTAPAKEETTNAANESSQSETFENQAEETNEEVTN